MNLRLPGSFEKGLTGDRVSSPGGRSATIFQKLKTGVKKLWARRKGLEQKLDRFVFYHPRLAYILLMLGLPVGMVLAVAALTAAVMLPVHLIAGL